MDDKTAALLLDYVTAAQPLTKGGRHDFRVPLMAATAWAESGGFVPATNDMARQWRTNRRTVCKTLRRVEESGVVARIGETSEGRAIYAPNFEIIAERR